MLYQFRHTRCVLGFLNTVHRRVEWHIHCMRPLQCWKLRKQGQNSWEEKRFVMPLTGHRSQGHHLDFHRKDDGGTILSISQSLRCFIRVRVRGLCIEAAHKEEKTEQSKRLMDESLWATRSLGWRRPASDGIGEAPAFGCGFSQSRIKKRHSRIAYLCLLFACLLLLVKPLLLVAMPLLPVAVHSLCLLA